MSDYLTQSAVGREALSKKAQAALLVRLGDRPISDVFYAQRKYDGVSGIVFTGGGDVGVGFAESRVGTPIVTVDHIIEECRRIYGEGRVVFGEFWMPDTEQTTINGKVMRKQAAPEVEFVVFDQVTYLEYSQHVSVRPWVARWMACITPQPMTGPVHLARTYTPGSYGDEKAFCANLLRTESGYDGLVLRDPQGQWLPGKDKLGLVLKIKQVLEFDLEVIGVEEGLGKNAGRLGALLVRFKDGKTLKVSGMSDELREAWWADPSLIVGKIIEVHAVALSSQGSLREPRFKGVRHDKLKADY